MNLFGPKIVFQLSQALSFEPNGRPIVHGSYARLVRRNRRYVPRMGEQLRWRALTFLVKHVSHDIDTGDMTVHAVDADYGVGR